MHGASYGREGAPCLEFSARTTLAEAARCLARSEHDLGVDLVRRACCVRRAALPLTPPGA